MTTPYNVSLPLPPGWIELSPAEGPAREAWALQAARAIAGAEPPLEVVALLAAQLSDLAEDSRGRSPLLAAALVPAPLGPVAVVAEAWQLLPDSGVPLTIEGLVEQQRRESADTVLEPDIAAVDLPSGPAVRVHRILHGQRELSLRREVVEELTFLVLPPSTPKEGLVLTASWLDVSAGEDFLQAVDDLVSGLHVDPQI
jgi:hypothetical protein